MVDLKNPADRTFGEYGEDGYHRLVDERVYESNRFESSRGGRRKARHEMYMVQAFLAGLPAAQRILDVPCGMGRFTGAIREAGHRPVNVDLNAGMLLRAQARYDALPLLQGNVMQLPFADGAFDAALCFRLLHHLPDNLILATLTELRRVAGTVLTTFYSTRSIKYQRKKLLGKTVSGQYYSPDHLISLSRDAGWSECRHVNPYEIHRNLHGLVLA
ncbi:MAG: class I SAM-dependent methyltransferase [Pseudomonadota bacterium]